MTQIEVREARAEDVMEIVAIHGECLDILRQIYRPRQQHSRPQDGADLGERDDSQAQVQLVAIGDGRVLGGVACRFGGERLHLQSLQVLPTRHRRGVARRLIEGAGELASHRGAARLTLETIRQTGNVPIFERLGFQIVHAEVTDRFELLSGGKAVTVTLERAVPKDPRPRHPEK